MEISCVHKEHRSRQGPLFGELSESFFWSCRSRQLRRSSWAEEFSLFVRQAIPFGPLSSGFFLTRFANRALLGGPLLR